MFHPKSQHSTAAGHKLHGLRDDEVIGGYPNPSSRRFLAEKWKSLSAEDQLVLRATRSKRGIRCYVCGSLGFFRENCPNSCESLPPTPDSDDSDSFSTRRKKPADEKQNDNQPLQASHPIINSSSSLSSLPAHPIAAFWGRQGPTLAGGDSEGDEEDEEEEEKLTMFKIKQKLNPYILREQSEAKIDELRESDQHHGNHAFFAKADETYARNVAELTLHQVMRRLMRLLERQLMKNASDLEATFDTTLLAPPMEKEGKTFYPKEFTKNKDYREYFYARDMNKHKHAKLQYKNQASLRPSDDLDTLFRGESLSTDHLYIVKENAGESIHAKNTWKSIYGRHDLLANSDPSMAAKQRKLDKMFRSQGQWIRMQKKNMEFKNDRYEHLVFILRREMEKEHARETKLLLASKHEQKSVAVDLWQERLSSVDTMISVLKKYHFTAGAEEADFLLYCLHSWFDKSHHKVHSQHTPHHKHEEKAQQQHTEEEMKILEGKGTGDEEESVTTIKLTHNENQGRSLIAKSTNPYFQDSEFLIYMKKKEEKIYNLSKKGSVFTAEKHRQDVEERKKRQEEKRKAMTESAMLAENATGRRRGDKLPPLEQVMEMAKTHTLKVEEKEERVKRNRELIESLKPKDSFVPRRVVHPREKDMRRIQKRMQSFEVAGLGNRIRQGKDDDFAHALPALIPIPKAFDGDTPMISHTAKNIVYNLKKNMVLSDTGYTPQTVVPLYVRTTLLELEGTSKDGDPTQDELAKDRRYSHYLGRPLIRFNAEDNEQQKKTLNEHSYSNLSSSTRHRHSSSMMQKESLDLQQQQSALVKDLTALHFTSSSANDKQSTKSNRLHLPISLSRSISAGQSTAHIQELPVSIKDKKKRVEDARLNPMTRSLVRMAFTNPDPSLSDLKYLDDEF